MNVSSPLDQKYESAYNEESAVYDDDRFGSKRGEFASRFKNDLLIRILNDAGADPSWRILDCPAGTGRVTHCLVESGFKEVWAADISKSMLDVNQSKLPKVSGSSVDFSVTNMKELPFDDNHFDAVTMGSFFYLVPSTEYDSYVRDIYRVLKPGGIVIAEISNAIPAFNPLACARVLWKKLVLRRKIKSTVWAHELSNLFPEFEFVGYFGSEFPSFSGDFDAYSKKCKIFGERSPYRWFSGKFTVVLRKPVGV